MPDVSVQIVNYKTKKYLAACLDSVISDLKNSKISYEILVLDNHSGDDLSDLEERYKSEKIKFYFSDKNLGFGGGQNFLAGKCESKYLFVLNPDTEVKKGVIKKLFDFMESRPEAGMCGPRVMVAGRNFFFNKIVFWPKVFAWKQFFEEFFKIKIFDNIKYIEYDPIIGAALFIRRTAFLGVGGFDANLFLYFEETDLCNSLKKAGLKIFFVYDAVIKHWYGRSDVPKKIKADYFKQSRRYFYKKWFGEEARKILLKEESGWKNKFLERFL